VPAVAEAERLVVEGQFERAESVLRGVNSDIYGACEIEDMYRRRLEQMAAAGVTDENRAGVEAVFRKALHWSWMAFPSPHTAVEAEQYEDGRRSAKEHLIRVLGYEPAPA
jgi:hypothetical protein